MKVYCKEKKEDVIYEIMCVNCHKYDNCVNRESAGGIKVIGITFFSTIIAAIMIVGFIIL